MHLNSTMDRWAGGLHAITYFLPSQASYHSSACEGGPTLRNDDSAVLRISRVGLHYLPCLPWPWLGGFSGVEMKGTTNNWERGSLVQGLLALMT